jgi:hypothetical protein
MGVSEVPACSRGKSMGAVGCGQGERYRARQTGGLGLRGLWRGCLFSKRRSKNQSTEEGESLLRRQHRGARVNATVRGASGNRSTNMQAYTCRAQAQTDDMVIYDSFPHYWAAGMLRGTWLHNQHSYDGQVTSTAGQIRRTGPATKHKSWYIDTRRTDGDHGKGQETSSSYLVTSNTVTKEVFS